jgi:Domain of unknown function (DUF3597)
MSIFDALKKAIFGTESPNPQQPATNTTAQASAAATSAPGAATAAAPKTGSSPGIQVDIESVLSAKAAQKPEKLNWQSSIVDLMKLVDLDPSLENRKSLASELGYTGDTKDTASMNVWLHQHVMQELAAAGGKVPDALRH